MLICDIDHLNTFVQSVRGSSIKAQDALRIIF